MLISGEHRFKAPTTLVWETLLDAVALKAAIPGCEQLVATGPARYDVTVRVGLAAVKGTYRGDVHVQERREGQSYRLVVSGSGKTGNVQGGALFTLSDDAAGGTVVAYAGDLRAQGAIASLGARLEGSARLLIGQFFRAMEKQIEARAM